MSPRVGMTRQIQFTGFEAIFKLKFLLLVVVSVLHIDIGVLR